ncbi:hypothetical protein C0J52_03094 [Blattella germanica]|nr:hypothetical protein C0J52_03094 [Blattella germanica]
MILHNIIETSKDKFQQMWMEAVQQAAIHFPQPHLVVSRDMDSFEASRIRESLKNYMRRYPIRKSRLV